MLRITIPEGDYWDERTQEFFYIEGQTILLEHSLVSLAKWESKWKKPYLSKDDKTHAETIDYVRCMTLTPNVSARVYETLSKRTLDVIMSYINDPMTATTISERGAQKQTRKKIITAEVIYYWMVALQIPFDPCENWHLNRLLTLIRVCNAENQPKKKQSKKDLFAEHARINAENRKRLGTKG